MNRNIEKQANRNLISSEDFFEAKNYLEEAQSNSSSSDTILKALLMAATVTYCRPFTNNLGNDGATASISGKFVNELTDEEKELHKTLIELRNTVLAHSDFEKKSCKRMPEKGMAIMASVDFWHQDIDLELFHKLVCSMVRKCIKKDGELPR
ncbi:MAG: hypothetical protein L3K24_12515 [Gammaproteobacteria bacterium]|nr:hypothetical protein [Gammaproteobacteria bacterium]